jgi:hypothetical protein
MDSSITLFNLLTLAVALAAFVLSALSLWLAQLRRGRVFLTQPTIFFFGWDRQGSLHVPKIMFRSALFSSGNKGRILESMYVLVKTVDGQFEFPFWGYDDGKGMVRGSGLFVGPSGHVAYHHFNPLNDEHIFAYSGISYEVEVWAKVFNQNGNILLGKYQFCLEDSKLAVELAHSESGVLWSWSPQDRRYYPEAWRRPFDWPSPPFLPLPPNAVGNLQ